MDVSIFGGPSLITVEFETFATVVDGGTVLGVMIFAEINAACGVDAVDFVPISGVVKFVVHSFVAVAVELTAVSFNGLALPKLIVGKVRKMGLPPTVTISPMVLFPISQQIMYIKKFISGSPTAFQAFYLNNCSEIRTSSPNHIEKRNSNYQITNLRNEPKACSKKPFSNSAPKYLLMEKTNRIETHTTRREARQGKNVVRMRKFPSDKLVALQPL